MTDKKIKTSQIKLIVYDFDGVMTDNKVILREDGLESVKVNRSDGLSVGIIKKKGIPQVIITTEANKVVAARARKLGIPVIDDTKDKRRTLTDYCKLNNIPLRSVLFIGNDINDLEAMKAIGFPVCPSDAFPQIKKIARLVLSSKGGDGVVRDLLEHLK